MTEICYDNEFLEDGKTIELISIGMIREDGAEYYAVNSDMPIPLIKERRWLMENVVPHLPILNGKVGATPAIRGSFALDLSAAAVKPRWVIANEVRDFILAAPEPELWADYGAYDHVVLCQLWGPMMQIPAGVPMWTHDLRQERERYGNPELPSMPGAAAHNALDDAREVAYRLRWLREHAATA